MGAIVGYIVGAFVVHASKSAAMKVFWLAEHVVEDDDRDRHDDSSASHAAHNSHDDTPGLLNCPPGL